MSGEEQGPHCSRKYLQCPGTRCSALPGAQELISIHKTCSYSLLSAKTHIVFKENANNRSCLLEPRSLADVRSQRCSGLPCTGGTAFTETLPVSAHPASPSPHHPSHYYHNTVKVRKLISTVTTEEHLRAGEVA